MSGKPSPAQKWAGPLWLGRLGCEPGFGMERKKEWTGVKLGLGQVDSEE